MHCNTLTSLKNTRSLNGQEGIDGYMGNLSVTIDDQKKYKELE